nr:immunoglobulin light chain junction region [Macaca mulatta]MOY10365.1 immunoglobulin light chain junction region [Macaca mulatta]MOY10397.1 immunoglobulin light chain junction region [Macaca mulatta]MOY10407.1 immunoglobulin light chain junction region [Macaca mulatta]MOY10424.1 immunoglobulin light chain junction region [Macaca mulatta]
CQQYHDLLTF